MGDDETKRLSDRANLRYLLDAHPTWKNTQFAQATHRSIAWVKKWKKRLAALSPDDRAAPLALAPHRPQPPPQFEPKHPDSRLVERILYYRDELPKLLNRLPGPKTLLYYLGKDDVLQALGLKVCNSTSFIWRILTANGRILRRTSQEPRAWERPEPLQSWQIDFKDCTSVQIEPDGKHAHVVEVLNVVDEGTSILVDCRAHSDFNAETVIDSVLEIINENGLPQQVTFDRDPRFVGSASSRDFPSAFVRFWECLGVTVNLCPPHRPDLNCFVERYHRAFGEECLARHQPENLAQVIEVSSRYKEFYNRERPHQGVACGNRPPLVSFPPRTLPFLPCPPLVVDPDRWVGRHTGQSYTRKVDTKGSVKIGKFKYYLGKRAANQYVSARLDSTERQLVFYLKDKFFKRLALKGLENTEMAFSDFVAFIKKEAVSERRQAQMAKRSKAQAKATAHVTA
jgi:hypothetical protein